MGLTELRQERRARDRSQGLTLRRRRNELIEASVERRRSESDGFDIAAALEMHLDECTTRRAMLALLESWLAEATSADSAEQDKRYVQAVERAIEVMKSSPDPLSAIAVLQRRPES
jgi:hypothetical protein